ncbi:patatin-like phospholipase family protein [Chitinimonas viridis]|uniref:Patatin-like phospholipase family protein n=1 Tax=Chitinimonas viridis TaxID=664880 RepID=A0ABT8B2W1_9NEIS|nr:patatin-like phospholipase family protein [Chitinimonas viridis]MDN3576468.1 patatin-like phospholipase family protein [Chitinimonas viridis]
MRRLACNALISTLLAVGLAQAAERPRVALVLGGGGARGLAHVGVLKVLEEARVPVDCVVGTSMGALVGGIYASGRSAADVDATVRQIDWDDVLDDRPQRQQRSYRDKQDDWFNMMNLGLGVSDTGQLLFPKGAINTQKVDLLIRQLVNNATLPSFDGLPVPYRAVAADLETGDMVVLSRGDLAAAMRASMAVPGVFPPVERDTRVLVDGGIARNLPVDVARGLCGDVVIAVDVSSPLLTRKQTTDVLAISDQTVRALMQRNVDEQLKQLGTRDILITPQLGNLSPTAFADALDAVAAGEEAARLALPSLLAYRVNEAGWQQWRQQLAGRVYQPGPVRAVVVDSTRFVNPNVLKDALEVKTGEPLDVPAFHDKLGKVYASGDFEQIDYRMVRDGDGETVQLLPKEKPWGPGYLDLGLGLRTDFDDDAAFQLSAQYRRSWINARGAEWKTRLFLGQSRGLTTQFYQPLNRDGTFFTELQGRFSNDSFPIYFEGERLAEYRLAERGIKLDLGSLWGRWGEMRLGLEYSRKRLSRATGDPALGEGRGNEGGVHYSLVYDQLDSARFPREGSFAGLHLYSNLTKLGGEANYHKAQWTLKHAQRWGNWAAYLDTQYDYSREAEINALPRAGGLFKLSSYGIDELRAERIFRSQFRLSQDVTRLTPLLGTAGFWGFSLEAARIWQPLDNTLDSNRLLYSGTVFVGSDTRLGPAYFAVSYGDNKHGKVYLSINGGF